MVDDRDTQCVATDDPDRADANAHAEQAVGLATNVGMVLALVALVALGIAMIWPRGEHTKSATNVKQPVATETPASTQLPAAKQTNAPPASTPAK
jgi:hypothetical protein